MVETEKLEKGKRRMSEQTGGRGSEMETKEQTDGRAKERKKNHIVMLTFARLVNRLFLVVAFQIVTFLVLFLFLFVCFFTDRRHRLASSKHTKTKPNPAKCIWSSVLCAQAQAQTRWVLKLDQYHKLLGMIADTNSIWNICWYIDWNTHSIQFQCVALPSEERAKNDDMCIGFLCGLLSSHSCIGNWILCLLFTETKEFKREQKNQRRKTNADKRCYSQTKTDQIENYEREREREK